MPLRAPSIAPRAPSAALARRASRVSRARRRAARPAAANDDALGAFLPRRRPRRRADDDAKRADDDANERRATDDAATSTSTPIAASTFVRAYDDDDAPRDARRETRRKERDAYVARKRAREARKHACECVVVVEGGADVRAVRNKAGFTSERAKVVAVRHRGAFRRRPNGEMEVKRERMDEIEELSVKYDAPIVVLFDCDTAGRQLRNAFLRRFPDATHAFMGARVSSAKEDGKWHARGNVGVEHGEGEDIARAIARRAPRRPRSRGVHARGARRVGARRRRRRRRRLGRLRRRRAAQTIGGRVPRRGRLRRATVTSPVEPVLHRRRRRARRSTRFRNAASPSRRK